MSPSGKPPTLGEREEAALFAFLGLHHLDFEEGGRGRFVKCLACEGEGVLSVAGQPAPCSCRLPAANCAPPCACAACLQRLFARLDPPEADR